MVSVVVPMTPEQVAKAFIAGLHRTHLVGWQSHLAVWCNFIAPRLVEKVLLMAAPLYLRIDKSTTKDLDMLAMSR